MGGTRTCELKATNPGPSESTVPPRFEIISSEIAKLAKIFKSIISIVPSCHFLAADDTGDRGQAQRRAADLCFRTRIYRVVFLLGSKVVQAPETEEEK